MQPFSAFCIYNDNRMSRHVRAITSLFSGLYAQITPRGRGVVLLLAVTFLCAVVTDKDVVYRVAYFLALAVGGSYVYLRLRLRGLDMRMLDKSYVAQVGDTLKVQVYLRNNTRLQTGWVEIVPMTDIPGGVSGIATAIAARGQERLEIRTFCHARGHYTVGPLLARTADPLGLFCVETRQGDRARVVIHPPVMMLPYFRLPAAERAGEESTRYRSESQTPHVGTVREYIYGDSLSQIHWLSTAKSGQLMSKEFDSGRGSDVWVVLDLEQKIHYSRGTERTDEYAVAIAASLTDLVLKEERSVGLIAYGDREYVLPLGAGAKQMSTIVDMLTLSRTEGNTALAKVLVRNATQFGRSASLLVITSSAATEWMSVLRELRYRGLNVVVALVDPTGFGGKESLDEVAMGLVSAGIPVYVVHRGDNLPYALSRPIMPDDLLMFKQWSNAEQVLASQTHGDLSPGIRTPSRGTC